jgi:hypothetical protein
MTLDRILGFVIGTILVGIGLKVGESLFKESKILFKELFDKESKSEDKKYKEQFMDANIIPSS